jgi:hypothetical protein
MRTSVARSDDRESHQHLRGAADLPRVIDEFFLHGAGGAVGTEITVFVDFATDFADPALRCYASGETLSQSLRRARIEGLRRKNPMGSRTWGSGYTTCGWPGRPARPETRTSAPSARRRLRAALAVPTSR